MKNSKILLAFVVALALLLAPATEAAVNSNVATVAISINVAESITISATPASVVLVLNGHQDYVLPASSPVVVTTTYTLGVGHTSLSVWSYFATPGVALVNGGSTIPTSAFLQAVFGGPSGSDCNQSGPFSATDSCAVIQTVANPAPGNGTLTSSLLFGTDPAHFTNFIPGTYSGTINFAAQAI
jgi:hypothetical protein